MARTPVFRALRQAFREACSLDAKNPQPHSRRDFIKISASLGAVTAFDVACTSLPKGPPHPVINTALNPRVAIVGAGLAGLSCAYHLQKAGIASQIFESQETGVGGRIHSVRGAFAPDLMTEFGGEFIDSSHDDMLGFVKEFNLALHDFRSDSENKFAPLMFFQGRRISAKQLSHEVRPLVRHIIRDLNRMGTYPNFLDPQYGQQLDRMPLSLYLEKAEVKGWLYRLIEAAYVSEFGLELDEQSSLNLITLIQTDLARPHFELYGESDERFSVVGGNAQICQEIATRLTTPVQLGMTLEDVREKGPAYELTFRKAGGGIHTAIVDTVVLALPFSLLREMNWRQTLPPPKLQAIRDLGYGTNAKQIVSYAQPFWRGHQLSGASWTDLEYQTSWDSSRLRNSSVSTLTFYSGGKLGGRMAQQKSEVWAQRFHSQFAKAIGKSHVVPIQKSMLVDWPQYRWAKGSYSCFKPGQWTQLAPLIAMPVGRLYFAGEHCSKEFQGYMNGAAQSGRLTAQQLIRDLQTPETKKAGQSLTSLWEHQV